jgi:hypothetical protein
MVFIDDVLEYQPLSIGNLLGVGWLQVWESGHVCHQWCGKNQLGIRDQDGLHKEQFSLGFW